MIRKYGFFFYDFVFINRSQGLNFGTIRYADKESKGNI